MTLLPSRGLTHRGVSFRLNMILASRQGLVSSDLDAILEKHRELIDVRYAADGVTDRGELRRVAAEVERCEFELQDLWKFERDVACHSHWLSIPGCTCPVRANIALWRHPVRLIAEDCPVFGGTVRDDITLVPTKLSEPARRMPTSFSSLLAA